MTMRNILLVILLLMMLSIFGCGGPDGAAPPIENGKAVTESGGETAPGGSEAPGEVADLGTDEEFSWMSLGSMDNLVEIVKEMRWKMDGNIFHYAYLGSETVDGVNADVVSINIDDAVTTFWVDSSGEIVQVAIDDEYMPAEMLDYMGMYLLAPLLPFQIFAEELSLQQALSGQNIPGMDITRQDRVRETIGGQTVDVHIMEMMIDDSHTLEFRFADFENIRLMLSWNVLEGGEKGEEFAYFEIEEIIFR